ncbi:hypothetical protein B0H13DRAFT_1855578 [Mycena leptocephala]|nr:hypothetical protein B0H13DRAFT_1855578 [Mycena leptocephala]
MRGMLPQSSNQYRSHPAQYPIPPSALEWRSDRGNWAMPVLDNSRSAGVHRLSSIQNFLCRTRLPSTSLSAPSTTEFAHNLGPPTTTQYLVDPNIHHGGYYTEERTQVPNNREEHHGFRDVTPAQFASLQEPTATIHNGTFISGNVNNTVRHGESGLNILHRISAMEAFHDPANSYDQPPETRIEMQDKLWNRCINGEWRSGTDSLNMEPTILWVHGPAGAGKSAIMQTLSQRLENAGRLGGTFFFKRPSHSSGNGVVDGICQNGLELCFDVRNYWLLIL